MPKIFCRDGIFTIKTLLNMRNCHNLPTLVAFVDLVKAFDTAGHELLIKVLERYGDPPKFFSSICRMYQDLIVIIKIGKSTAEIIQEVEVRQGDNMAPFIFPFLMVAFSESLKEIWEDNQLEKLELQQVSEKDFEKGEGFIKIHTKYQYKLRKVVKFTVLWCILFDDRTFTFEAHEQLNKVVQVIHNHFYPIRIDMHVGKSVDGKIMASTTKCVLFSTPNIFGKHISS